MGLKQLRFLYFTDTHLRGNPPEARVDDFAESVKAKLREIVSLAGDLGVAAAIHGGDLFDVPEPGLGQVGEYLEILRGLPCPLYIVEGNHDIYGHNPATLPRTLLGLLVRLGVVRLLTPEPVYFGDGNVRVQITGRGFHAEIDRRSPALDYAAAKRGCDVAVHVAHGMALPGELDGAGFLPVFTPLADIAGATEADYTLLSHYHFPFEAKIDGKRFLNPGSLVRLSAHPSDAARMPQVLVLDIDGAASHRFVPLSCARLGEEVLDRAHLDARQYREERREAFLASLGEMRAAWSGAVEPEAVLRETLARMGAGAKVEAEAWRRFQLIQSAS